MSQPFLLNLRNLACGYQDQRVVQNLNLHLNAGDIGCLLGSSGCGKTTTLRAIAGFEPVHEGEISLDLLDDPRSVAWDQAENRLHAQKALLEFLVPPSYHHA